MTGSAMVLILTLAPFVWRSRTELGFQGWIRTMQAKGERFTVAEILKDRPMDTNDCQEVIESAASKVKSLIARRVNTAAANSTQLPAGRRIPIWAGPSLTGYDGWNSTWAGAQWELALMKNELQKVHAALQRVPADPGWDYENLGIGASSGIQSGSFVSKRSVAQTLGNALLCELKRTDLPAAQAHLLALVRMTRLHEQGWNFLNQMIRSAIAGLAVSATWEALQAPGWSEAQLAELQHEWEQYDAVTPMIRTLEMERALAIPYFDSFRRANTYPPFSSPTLITNLFHLAVERHVLAPIYKLAWLHEDKWYYLRHSQGYLEALRELSRHKSWKLAKPAVQQQFIDYTSRVTRLSRYRYPVTHEVVPNFRLGFESMNKNQTLQQLALAATAIRRHQLRTGQPPARLEDLVPDYSPSLPIDYWDGRPIRYRVQSDGAFILYSCGANLRDDGGDPSLDTVWETPEWGKTARR